MLLYMEGNDYEGFQNHSLTLCLLQNPCECVKCKTPEMLQFILAYRYIVR